MTILIMIGAALLASSVLVDYGDMFSGGDDDDDGNSTQTETTYTVSVGDALQFGDDDDDVDDDPVSDPVDDPVDDGGAVLGSDTADTLTTGDGSDLIAAGDGDDTISAGDDNDFVDAGAGDDTVDGAAGADNIFGGQGDDTVDGGDSNDVLIGGEGSDVLIGGDGNDNLDASTELSRELTPEEFETMTQTGALPDDVTFILDDQAYDLLDGGAGDDVLLLGNNDEANGGTGADTFVVRDDDIQGLNATAANGALISDFDPSEDKLEVLVPQGVATPSLTMSENANGFAQIFADGTLIATLDGVATSQVDLGQIVFRTLAA